MFLCWLPMWPKESKGTQIGARRTTCQMKHWHLNIFLLQRPFLKEGLCINIYGGNLASTSWLRFSSHCYLFSYIKRVDRIRGESSTMNNFFLMRF